MFYMLNCKHQDQRGNYCTVCGFDLSVGKDKKCDNCGYMLKADDNYCGNCGKSRFFFKIYPEQDDNKPPYRW